MKRAKEYRFIKIVKNNKCLIRIKLNQTPERYNTNKGEIDIIFDAKSKLFFDLACIQTRCGKQCCKEPVNSVSWHGFYDERGGSIKPPVINFKHNNDKIWCYRHTGTINQRNIFLFPICSFYIPDQMKMNGIPDAQINAFDYIVEIDNRDNARIDFFVLPKGVTIRDFLSNFSISAIYLISDITVFNKNLNGELNFLPAPEDNILLESTRLGEWDTFLRTIYTETTREPELCGKFSILFHDPNNTIDMLLDRFIGYPDDNGGIITDYMRRIYEEEYRKFRRLIKSIDTEQPK